MLKVIPIWVWVLLAGALAVGFQELRISWKESAYVALQQEYAAHLVDDADARLKAEQAARTEEQRQQKVVDNAREEAQQRIAKAESSAADAAAAADGLRGELRKVRSREATSNATAAAGSKARESVTSVLAGLLDESVALNVQLAKEADRSRNAGLTCEASYDGVRR